MTFPTEIEISHAKLGKYLLDPTSKDGASKAKLLLANGFDPAHLDVLANALFAHARRFMPGKTIATRYGTKFVLEGPMVMPNGTTHVMCSVWQMDYGSSTLRFITAY